MSSYASLARAKKSNPILECYTAEPEAPKPLKVMVPTYMDSQQWLINRPRGLARASYSDHSKSKLNFDIREAEAVKPSKKMIQPAQSAEVEYKGIRVWKEPEKNPISQDDASFEPPPVRPRQQQANKSQIQLTDSCQETPQLTKRSEMLSRKNSSNVFETEGNADPFERHKRRVASNAESLGTVLQYKYSLPYRQDKLTEKPSEGRLKTKQNGDLHEFRGVISALKHRMQTSNVTF